MLNTITAAAVTAAAATLDRKALVAALALLGKTVERRNTIPVLSCLKVDVAADGAVTMAGTDLDLDLSVTLDGAHAVPGSILVDCHAFKATVAKVKGAQVRIADAGGALTVTDCANGATVRLSASLSRALSDFPRVAVPDAPHPLDIDATTFRDDLSRIATSISTEETRYYLNGTFMHLATDIYGREVFRMASTDGHRLTRITRDVPASLDGRADRHPVAIGVIIPRKACQLIRDIIGKAAGVASLAVTDSKFLFRFGAAVLRGKLIDGTFPDYSRVIPSDESKGFDAPSGVLADAVAGATAHCDEKTRCVTLGMMPTGAGRTEWFTASATSPEHGRSGAVVDGIKVIGAAGDSDHAIGFNGAYLRTLCDKVFPDALIQVRFADAAAPALITSPDLPHVAAVLMPMRTDAGATTPEAIRRLHRNPADAFVEDAPAMLETADNGANLKQVRHLARKAFGKMVGELRAYLAPTYPEPRRLRLAMKRAVLDIAGDASGVASHREQADRLDTVAGSFSALAIVAPVSTPEAAAVSVATPEPVAAAPEAPTAVPETPVADMVTEGAPTSLDTARDWLVDALAIECAGTAPDCERALMSERSFRTFVGMAYGLRFPEATDGWARAQGRQRDRKARNHGKLVLSFHQVEKLRAVFDAAIEAAEPFGAVRRAQDAAHAAAEPACPVIEPAPAAVTPDLSATVAALAARVAALEGTARPPRTAAHLRAIRAYLRERAARRAAHRRASVEAATAGRLERELEGAKESYRTLALRVGKMQESRDGVMEDCERLDGEADRLRVSVAQLEHALAATRAAGAADRAELERLAPLLTAFATVQPRAALAPTVAAVAA